MKDVSIIIISYNTEEILRECLESIESSNIACSYEVIVVDNASRDGSVEMVKKEFKKVMIIKNSSNVGFSRANNIGVKTASGKYILFLNSDTKVFKNSIDTIYDFMESHVQVGAATCKVELVNGKIDDSSHRGFPTPWNALCHFSGLSKVLPRLFGGYNLAWMDLSTTHEIDACAGAYMMVRREAGEQVGWWDEDYFWYGDDLDFCYRLKKSGWKIYYVPTVSILHYKGVSGGIKEISKNISPASRETKIAATQARFDAMKIFYDKHYKTKYPYIVTRLVLSGVQLKQFIAKKSI